MFGRAAEIFLCFLLQLLSTVDATVSDVSGLHDKLDRKKKVGPFSPRVTQTSQRAVSKLKLVKVVCFVTLSVFS